MRIVQAQEGPQQRHKIRDEKNGNLNLYAVKMYLKDANMFGRVAIRKLHLKR